MIVATKTAASERSRRILSHLLITEREYYERLYGKDSTGFDFWPELSIEELGVLARENAERYDKLLRRFEEEGLDLSAKYRSSTGLGFENTFRELLTHVLLHSATHRGNIIVRLREDGGEPPETDYVIYLRETKYI